MQQQQNITTPASIVRFRSCPDHIRRQVFDLSSTSSCQRFTHEQELLVFQQQQKKEQKEQEEEKQKLARNTISSRESNGSSTSRGNSSRSRNRRNSVDSSGSVNSSRGSSRCASSSQSRVTTSESNNTRRDISENSNVFEKRSSVSSTKTYALSSSESSPPKGVLFHYVHPVKEMSAAVFSHMSLSNVNGGSNAGNININSSSSSGNNNNNNNSSIASFGGSGSPAVTSIGVGGNMITTNPQANFPSVFFSSSASSILTVSSSSNNNNTSKNTIHHINSLPTIQTQVSSVQKVLNQLEYNFLPLNSFFDLRKKRSLRQICETSREILAASLPIRCLEAVFLSLLLTNSMKNVLRFSVSLTSEAAIVTKVSTTSSDNNININSPQQRKEQFAVFKHIVLGIIAPSSTSSASNQHNNNNNNKQQQNTNSSLSFTYGALGLSRRDTLMDKTLQFNSLIDFIEDYRQHYFEVGHRLASFRLGIPIEHDVLSRNIPCWNFIEIVIPANWRSKNKVSLREINLANNKNNNKSYEKEKEQKETEKVDDTDSSSCDSSSSSYDYYCDSPFNYNLEKVLTNFQSLQPELGVDYLKFLEYSGTESKGSTWKVADNRMKVFARLPFEYVKRQMKENDIIARDILEKVAENISNNIWYNQHHSRFNNNSVGEEDDDYDNELENTSGVILFEDDDDEEEFMENNENDDDVYEGGEAEKIFKLLNNSSSSNNNSNNIASPSSGQNTPRSSSNKKQTFSSASKVKSSSKTQQNNIRSPRNSDNNNNNNHRTAPLEVLENQFRIECLLRNINPFKIAMGMVKTSQHHHKQQQQSSPTTKKEKVAVVQKEQSNHVSSTTSSSVTSPTTVKTSPATTTPAATAASFSSSPTSQTQVINSEEKVERVLEMKPVSLEENQHQQQQQKTEEVKHSAREKITKKLSVKKQSI